MQRDSRLSLSASAAAAPNPPRALHAPRASSDPGDPPARPPAVPSDLGSDDEWQCPMGSDTGGDSSGSEGASAGAGSGEDEDDACARAARGDEPRPLPAYTWSASDADLSPAPEEHAVVNPLPLDIVPPYCPPNFDAVDVEEDEEEVMDDEAQLLFIRGYKGVTSRSVARDDDPAPVPAEHMPRCTVALAPPSAHSFDERGSEPAKSGSASSRADDSLPTWADRPRSSHLSIPETPSRQGSPGPIPIVRTESDSALSSLCGSTGSGSALRMSGRAISEVGSESSRRSSKSVSFIARAIGPARGHDAVPSPVAVAVLAPQSSAFTADSASQGSRPPSSSANSVASSPPQTPQPPQALGMRSALGQRMSIRDTKARLSTTRLSSSKRQARRKEAAEQKLVRGSSPGTLESQGSSTSPFSGSPRISSLPRSLSAATSMDAHSAARGTGGPRPLSSQSEDPTLGLHEYGLSHVAQRALRPVSAPQPHQSFESGATTPTGARAQGGPVVAGAATGESGVFTHYPSALSVSTPSASNQLSAPPGFSSIPTGGMMSGHRGSPPSEDDTRMSFLECVVDILKGTLALKRKNFVVVQDAWLWLTSDMAALKWRVPKRGSAPTYGELQLSRVRKLRGGDREISLEVVEGKKPIEFVLRNRECANMWFSALCCLVPSRASVKSRHLNFDRREIYDPLLDSWKGKPLESRKRLNEYILLGTIGRGTFGKVKLALSTENRQFYAIKVLSKNIIRKQNRTSPFINSDKELCVAEIVEIAAMRKLNHTNCVLLRGVFDDLENDFLYIVVEYVAKGPIMNSFKLIDEKPIGEDRARAAFLDVLTGLEYLHFNAVVHRDIKPDNLLLSGNNTVKISDFGSAKIYDESSEDDGTAPAHNATVGTPAFTAPELCLSEKSPPAPDRLYAADIWSLGATLFYMVYGRAPFFARSVFEMYDAICTKPLEFPDSPSVSKSLRDLLTVMLDKSPTTRASIAQILESPWLGEGEDTEKLDILITQAGGRTRRRGTRMRNAPLDGKRAVMHAKTLVSVELSNIRSRVKQVSRLSSS